MCFSLFQKIWIFCVFRYGGLKFYEILVLIISIGFVYMTQLSMRCAS